MSRNKYDESEARRDVERAFVLGAEEDRQGSIGRETYFDDDGVRRCLCGAPACLCDCS